MTIVVAVIVIILVTIGGCLYFAWIERNEKE